ncbi:MAG TPA: branched-chain amino acid ABC transporter permease [Acidimicrobiales bacterium]|nr:branched-chain amino acid ABC transporter permease [Acidimicrobiales bacterium]
MNGLTPPTAGASRAGARLPGARRAQGVAWLVFGAFLIAFPALFTNPTITSIAVFTLIFMTSTTAWNAFSGYSGYLALGHAAFFGTGAYTLAVLTTDLHTPGGYGVFWFVPLGGVVASLAAIPVGLVALRTRRHTFVVITIAIFFIFQLLATNFSFTGSSSGEQTPTPSWSAAGYNDRFYYAALVCLAIALALAVLIRRSRFGLQLLAIRDDEDRAAGLGVRVTRVKLVAFVVSAFSVGMVGAVYAYFLGQIYPQFAFDPLFDLTIALMAFLGGLGTLSGPLLGAMLLEPLQQYFTLQFSAGDVYLIVYGALFLVVILLMPRGIVPAVTDFVATRRVRRSNLAEQVALGQGGTQEVASGPAVADQVQAVPGGA